MREREKERERRDTREGDIVCERERERAGERETAGYAVVRLFFGGLCRALDAGCWMQCVGCRMKRVDSISARSIRLQFQAGRDARGLHLRETQL